MITKENGHPVSLGDISLLPNKTKPLEACDVPTQYNALFPLLSNSSYRSICLSPSSRILAEGCSPDKRFEPICHLCGQKALRVHSWSQRSIRDLNLASTQVYLHCHFRKIFCLTCGQIVIEEDLELLHPYFRVTKRLALYIHCLCRVMTVKEVADHLDLNWKTVKNIDKYFLEAQYGTPHFDGLRLLAVDEIAIRKGQGLRHRYG